MKSFLTCLEVLAEFAENRRGKLIPAVLYFLIFIFLRKLKTFIYEQYLVFFVNLKKSSFYTFNKFLIIYLIKLILFFLNFFC